MKCNGIPMFVTKLHRYIHPLLAVSPWEKENNRQLEICDRSQEGIVQRQKKDILRLPNWICVLSMIEKEITHTRIARDLSGRNMVLQRRKK